MRGGGEGIGQPLCIFGRSAGGDRLAGGIAGDLQPAARLGNAHVGEEAARALHLVERAGKQMSVANGLKMAGHPPAVERQGDAGHAAEEIGHRALFRKAAGIIAEIGDHGLQLPVAEKDGILEALGPGGECGARMRRHGTGASPSAIAGVLALCLAVLGELVLCLAILGEDLPPLRRAGLEAADERAQGLGQGLVHEDDEMKVLGHQLPFDNFHLRVEARHFHERRDHRLAERGGLNAGGGGNCGARMRRHGTAVPCLAIFGEGVPCLAIIGEDQLPQPFPRAIRQGDGDHVDRPLAVIPAGQSPGHAMFDFIFHGSWKEKCLPAAYLPQRCSSSASHVKASPKYALPP